MEPVIESSEVARILAVDDNSFNLYVLKELLKDSYAVKTCLSGDEALNFIKCRIL